MSHSTLILNANGSYDDTPYNNFNGSDSFTYTLTDAVAGESDTRTVDITITAVDDASVIIAPANCNTTSCRRAIRYNTVQPDHVRPTHPVLSQ